MYNDNRFTFRPLATEKISDDKLNLTTSIYPNPTKGEVRFNIPEIKGNEQLDCVVTDASGRTVLRLRNHLNAIQKTISTTLTGKEQGIYFIQISYRTKVYNTRLIKL
ncbi:MAG: T9SS type A sorting domain-containing protein [Ferruginibacter sp.]|nr:T9SS type A sorting domain-containing protein [Ferruginibacter sp.]